MWSSLTAAHPWRHDQQAIQVMAVAKLFSAANFVLQGPNRQLSIGHGQWLQ